jgi:hypothetical protein
MAWGFEIGRIYNRRIDIHARFGGQQQGGIITPAQHPVVIIITGEEGLEHGYADRYRPDGVFEYFGEGQVGDIALRCDEGIESAADLPVMFPAIFDFAINLVTAKALGLTVLLCNRSIASAKPHAPSSARFSGGRQRPRSESESGWEYRVATREGNGPL